MWLQSFITCSSSSSSSSSLDHCLFPSSSNLVASWCLLSCSTCWPVVLNSLHFSESYQWLCCQSQSVSHSCHCRNPNSFDEYVTASCESHGWWLEPCTTRATHMLLTNMCSPSAVGGGCSGSASSALVVQTHDISKRPGNSVFLIYAGGQYEEARDVKVYHLCLK